MKPVPEIKLFIGGFQDVPLNSQWFDFLWLECDSAYASTWGFQQHKDYVLMLMGV